ncbi:MAG TPA: methyltransferase domain-containing protein [Thermomicrobiales bacterium]|nr:methyltransferase domain-containing protein [Thermomicrobiales bacterium]
MNRRRIGIAAGLVAAAGVTYVVATRKLRRACPTALAWWLASPLVDLVAGTRETLGWIGARPGERVLEVGPGPGRLLLPTARRILPGGVAVGLDLQPGMARRLAAHARQENAANLAVVVGDAAALPFAPASFDVVYLSTVLGEIHDRAAALAECRRVVRPGGRLSVTEILPDPHYQNQEAVRRLAESAGFRSLALHGGRRRFTANFARADDGDPPPATAPAVDEALSETERARRFYDRFAGQYDRSVALDERLLFGDGRRWVCAQARGDVLEVAVGTGLNLPYYPPDARLTGVELSPAMLALARGRAAALGRDADLRLGDAQALDFPDESFDTVVAMLALSTIPDSRRAVAEAWRVLRPGGRLLLLDHVRSPNRAVRAVQRALDPLSVSRYAHHLLRDPLDDILATGFTVERLERAKLGLVERLVARK